MTKGEMLKIMADTVAESQNCVLEVLMGETTAIAHLIPLEEWRAEWRVTITMRRTNQEYDWMEGSKNQSKYKKPKLSPFFLRKPYEGTTAEPKDDTQERLHEFDYLK